MKSGDIQTVIKALEACRYEFTTLIPRLTPMYQKNADACRNMAEEAIAILRKAREEQEGISDRTEASPSHAEG